MMTTEASGAMPQRTRLARHCSTKRVEVGVAKMRPALKPSHRGSPDWHLTLSAASINAGVFLTRRRNEGMNEGTLLKHSHETQQKSIIARKNKADKKSLSAADAAQLPSASERHKPPTKSARFGRTASRPWWDPRADRPAG